MPTLFKDNMEELHVLWKNIKRKCPKSKAIFSKLILGVKGLKQFFKSERKCKSKLYYEEKVLSRLLIFWILKFYFLIQKRKLTFCHLPVAYR